MSKKILLIDDEHNLVSIMKMLLEKNDYEVITAHEARKGLRKIKTEKPDLVVLDILLPGENGYQLLHEIRGQKGRAKNIPVIVVSGRGKMKKLFENWEISDFIEKPFDAQTILSKIKKALPQIDVDKKEGVINKKVDKKALIIGSEVLAVEAIRAFLESHKFSIAIAQNGPEGIKEALEIRPGLVFIQPIIEEMKEAEICRILREIPGARETPFIIFSTQSPKFMLDNPRDNTKVITYSRPKDLVEKINEHLKKCL